jgi:phosphoribosylpyrophosphate synthetase
MYLHHEATTALTVFWLCCRLMEQGALGVTAIVTHGLFSRDAVDKINRTPELDSVVVSLALSRVTFAVYDRHMANSIAWQGTHTDCIDR